MSPRSASMRGQAKGRNIGGVTAAISIMQWDWVLDTDGQPQGDGFEPVAYSFRTNTLFIVNGPLPGASEADVTFVLNGPRAGEGLMIVLSAADTRDFMLTLTVLWAGHSE